MSAQNERMTAWMDGHVRLDERGVAYGGDSRLKLIYLVIACRSGNDSVEHAREAFDWLPEADLFGALAYYLDPRAEVDRAIQEYGNFADQARTAAGESDLAQRLKSLRGSC